MSLVVSSRVTVFCSFYIGLLHDERNELFQFYPTNCKERRKERKLDGNDRKSSVSYIENLDTVELKFNNVFKLSFENDNAKSYYNSLVVSITSYSSNTK